MKLESGNFLITHADNTATPVTLRKDGLVIGRLPSCDIFLNHLVVSRIHAGINRVGADYFLINLSLKNTLTLNGRLLAPEEVDALADGDVIQIGPFALVISRQSETLLLFVTHQFTGDVTASTSRRLPALGDLVPQPPTAEVTDVLKVFWEKRTRDKEDWGTALRPVGKPMPGKAQINWRPTNDLRGAWRGGLFAWTLLIIGVLSVAAFYLRPQIFAPAELSNPHTRASLNNMEAGFIAARPNANSCTTCHTWSGKLEDACIKCHQASAFHATNTIAHEQAGVSCTSCHSEHQGQNFEPRVAAINSCAKCHNNNNHQLYNGKSVSTPHRGGEGYPAEIGEWRWEGLKPETAAMTLDVTKFRDPADTEQMRRSKEFHALHLYRVAPAPGMKTDAAGAMSCSSCHTSFAPLDRETPRQTCAKCHSGYTDSRTGRALIAEKEANCVSCHVQHYYDRNRWNEYLTASTESQRAAAIAAQIKQLNGGTTNQQ
ncbi:MAG: FHA domain-containing protein [Pyrinomonadaceae bacterium]